MMYLFSIVIPLLFVLLSYSIGQTANNDSIRLFLNIPSCTLEVYQGNEIIRSYAVAVGKIATPTPVGSFVIQSKETNPAWVYNNKIVPAGPYNPLGTRWLGFYRLYGLHGTNMPSSIGRAVSNGCIRMRNDDVAELYSIIPKGAVLTIVYQTIQLRKEKNSTVSIAVFPDIYKRGGASLNNAYKTFKEYGFDVASMDVNSLYSVLRESRGVFTPIAIDEDFRYKIEQSAKDTFNIWSKYFLNFYQVHCLLPSNLEFKNKLTVLRSASI